MMTIPKRTMLWVFLKKIHSDLIKFKELQEHLMKGLVLSEKKEKKVSKNKEINF